MADTNPSPKVHAQGPLTQGRWSADWPAYLGGACSIEGDDNDGEEDLGLFVIPRSPQDCDDLIALLQRVRERFG